VEVIEVWNTVDMVLTGYICPVISAVAHLEEERAKTQLKKQK